MLRTTEEKFWPKVEKTKTCWLWRGNMQRDGYGMAMRRGGKKRVSAHRLSWEIHNGEIPEEMRVLHTCHVRNCVNPRHLFLGEQKDRSRIGMRRRKD